MRVLLDTHAFLWLDAARNKLSPTAVEAFQNPDNEIYLSIASVWEIQIKTQLGRLTLPLPLPEMVRAQQAANGIRLLALELEHIYTLASLPAHHADPFDRVLLAQAQADGLTLMSNDSALAAYGAKLLW